MTDPIKTHFSRRAVLVGGVASVMAGAETARADTLSPFDRPVSFFEDDPFALPSAPHPPHEPVSEPLAASATLSDTLAGDERAVAASYVGDVPARSWIAFSPCPSGTNGVVDFIGGQDLDERRYPASLTKLMTFKLLADWVRANPNRWGRSFSVSRAASRQPASRLGLSAGSALSVRDAALGVMVVSANDAAYVIAENLAGSERAFARQMTRTTFMNASGLPDDNQITCAGDMAILVNNLMTDYAPDDRFAPIFDAGSMRFHGRTRERSGAALADHGIQRIKSGFTRASGYHYAVQCTRADGQLARIIVMGMDSIEQRDSTLIRMADEARAGILRPSGQMDLASGEWARAYLG